VPEGHGIQHQEQGTVEEAVPSSIFSLGPSRRKMIRATTFGGARSQVDPALLLLLKGAFGALHLLSESAHEKVIYALSDVSLCEGFRMPALPGRLASRGSGAGVRKPPRKETASRKGACAPRRSMGI